ncbi:MAG: tyrosine-type recombinase/integrase [Clostridia bacterium]|nr:tyrosine-type recombinase/integrase [Clostridia bacterium]MBQ4157541.1 tyrosine-type recombinase/integrase [Clostridia bacterium]
MAKELNYAQKRAIEITELTRNILKDMPQITVDYIQAIANTTQPLTRYAYARDLRMFFTYLTRENPKFAEKDAISWTKEDFSMITARDIVMYLDYLSLYIDENEALITNEELGKMRKFYSVRSFFKWMFKQSLIPSDVSALVDPPKRHEKPIRRLEIDEVARMLDAAETGDALTERQQKYHALTQKRDLAMLSLFLGTGIRVSECVGLDVQHVDFDLGAFLVTRKGGNQAILYFSEEVEKPLKEYIEERKQVKPLPGHENALFLSLQKRRMSVRMVEEMVKKYARIAAPLKSRISPHKLRSTFGTNLYNETGDIYLVADVLGHSDVNTTRRHYAAMSDERRRLAAKKITLRDDDKKQEG